MYFNTPNLPSSTQKECIILPLDTNKTALFLRLIVILASSQIIIIIIII